MAQRHPAAPAGKAPAFLAVAAAAAAVTTALALSPALAAPTEALPAFSAAGIQEPLFGCGGSTLGPTCREEEVEAAEDDMAESMVTSLLQVDLKPFRAVSAPRRTEVQEVMAERETQQPAVNCSEYPMFCNPKVDCAANPITLANRADWDKRLATADGHTNLRAWCMAYPLYGTSLQKCVLDGDSIGYAQETFAAQTQFNLVRADAVYCFVAGHCNNTEVNVNTTTKEAEEICDQKYGHEQWTKVGWQDFMNVLARAQQLVKEGTEALHEQKTSWADLVKLAKHESDISAMTACAMGNYHCDVFYCKQNYCHNPEFASFARLSWAS